MSSDNNKEVIGAGYIRPLYGARFQTRNRIISNRSTFNPYRSAQEIALPYVANQKLLIFNETLSKMQKMMIEDTFAADSTTRRCVTLFSKFLLGKRTKTTVDINKEFMTPQKQNQAVGETLNESEADDLRTHIDRINRQVKFREKLEGATIQTQLGGRSALLIEEEGGEPVDLKLLNWGKLGRVFADKDTWKLLAVEYADRPKDQPLRADEIIYFTWHDYHITPDSLYQGLSATLPIVDVAETIRIILSEDLKEASRVSTADAGVVKFPTNTSKAQMDLFTKDFIGGRYHATSADVDIQTFDLRPKIAEMSQLVKDLVQIIIDNYGVPEFLLNSNRVPNKAVADTAMNAWRESDLNHARSWLQGIVEPQWYDSLVLSKYEDIDIEQFRLKAKLEFEDITFESLKDKADAIIPLFQAGLITIEKALKILDMEDVLEQILAKQKLMEEQRRREFEMMKMEQEQNQQEQQGRGTGTPPQEETDTEEENIQEEEPPTPRVRTRRASVIPDNIVTKDDLQTIMSKPSIIEQKEKEVADITIQKEKLQMKMIEQEAQKRMAMFDKLNKLVEADAAEEKQLEQKMNA